MTPPSPQKKSFEKKIRLFSSLLIVLYYFLIIKRKKILKSKLLEEIKQYHSTKAGAKARNLLSCNMQL